MSSTTSRVNGTRKPTSDHERKPSETIEEPKGTEVPTGANKEPMERTVLADSKTRRNKAQRGGADLEGKAKDKVEGR